MNQSWHPRAKWLTVALLAGAAAVLWEIGADASRVQVVMRVLAGQRVALGSAGASDSFVLLSYLAEVALLGASLVLFLAWRRRPRGRQPNLSPFIAVWWVLWIGANLAGRLVELTYRGTSSLADIRNVALIDVADCVALGLSLLAMVVAVRRIERACRRGDNGSQATHSEACRIRAARAGARAQESARRGRAITAIVVAAFVVAPLTLGFIVSNGTMAASNAPVKPPAAAALWQRSNVASVTCPDAMFTPSGALAAGTTSTCANVTLGASLFSADCTKAKVPSGLAPEVFDNTGHSSALGAVAAAAGGCDLTTKSTSVTAAVLAGDSTGPVNEPGAVIVVADFIPSRNAAGVNTVGVRVSSSSEFDVALQSGGEYAVIESTNGATPEALLQGSFSVGQTHAPDLTKPVRVVVSMQGSTAAAYVDGVLLGAGPTTVPDEPGGCGFSLSSNDASHPAVATLLRLDVFAAG